MEVIEDSFDGEVPGHPDLTDLFRLIINARLVVMGDGIKDGVPFVIISAEEGDTFTFTKTDEGYTLVRQTDSPAKEPAELPISGY